MKMRENKRDAIMKCALELFAEKGYDAVSPNEIVEKVGVTKPTLYYFFGSKEGLLETLLKSGYGELETLLTARCVYEPHLESYREDVYPALVRVVNAYFYFAQKNTDFYMMVLSMWFQPPSSTAAVLSEKYHFKQFHILQGMFQEISGVHHNLRGKERIYVWRFLSLINAQIAIWRRGYGDLEEETAQSMVTGFMHGIFS